MMKLLLVPRLTKQGFAQMSHDLSKIDAESFKLIHSEFETQYDDTLGVEVT